MTEQRGLALRTRTKLLPYRRLEFHGPLSPPELSRRIAAAVEPKRWIRLRAPTGQFEGIVTESSFEVQRIIWYRNSFLPRVKGTIDAGPRGSRVTVVMSLQPLVLIFVVIWLGAAVAIEGVFLARAVVGGVPLSALLVPALMFLFGWALTSGAFAVEARKAERWMTELVQAEHSQGAPR